MLCPVCDGPISDVNCKLICSKCGAIVSNCGGD